MWGLKLAITTSIKHINYSTRVLMWCARWLSGNWENFYVYKVSKTTLRAHPHPPNFSEVRLISALYVNIRTFVCASVLEDQKLEYSCNSDENLSIICSILQNLRNKFLHQLNQLDTCVLNTTELEGEILSQKEAFL